MTDPATITAISAVIFNKAIEQSGRELGKAVTDKIGQIVSTERLIDRKLTPSTCNCSKKAGSTFWV